MKSLKQSPTLVLVMVLVMAWTSTLRSEDIRLAGMRLGTAWYVFSATLYKLMADEMPAGTRLEVMAKGGGIANPLLVESGKAQVALANRATAVWAREGHPLIYEDRACPNLRVLVGGLNTVPLSFIVTEAYIKRTGNDTIEKIFSGDEPFRVVMKPRGSTVPVLADLLFEALGSSRETIRANGGQIIQVSAKQIPNIMRNRQADIYLEAGPPGHPTVTEVSLTVPVRFLHIPQGVRQELGKLGLAETTIPEFWNGQDGPTRSIDVGTVIIAHRDLPEEVAYLITKTICENKEALGKAHKAWASFDPEKAGSPVHAGIPVHEGALKYYRERGWETE